MINRHTTIINLLYACTVAVLDMAKIIECAQLALANYQTPVILLLCIRSVVAVVVSVSHLCSKLRHS